MKPTGELITDRVLLQMDREAHPYQYCVKELLGKLANALLTVLLLMLIGLGFVGLITLLIVIVYNQWAV